MYCDMDDGFARFMVFNKVYPVYRRGWCTQRTARYVFLLNYYKTVIGEPLLET